MEVLGDCVAVFNSVHDDSILLEIADSEEGRNKLTGTSIDTCYHGDAFVLQGLLRCTEWPKECINRSNRQIIIL